MSNEAVAVVKTRKPRESAPKINVSQIVLKLLMESQGASIEAVADAIGLQPKVFISKTKKGFSKAETIALAYTLEVEPAKLTQSFDSAALLAALK
jgi:hypothetical protein